MVIMTPLEIYLKQEMYDWYYAGKEYELRAPFGQFSPKNVIRGRRVILYRGQTGISRKGVIGEVLLGSLDVILDKVEPEKFAPSVSSEEELKRGAVQIMGNHQNYIAFQVILD
jgi:hypothetical protein